MPNEIIGIEEQVYYFLTTTTLSYAEIGEKLGCSASTVSSRAHKLVKEYNLNPSILRANKRGSKYYAKYCANILCHQVIYLTTTQVKQNKPFHCCAECIKESQRVNLPDRTVIKDLYDELPFNQVAQRLNVSLGELARLFEHYNIIPNDFPENLLVTPAFVVQGQTQKARPKRVHQGKTKNGFRQHLGFTVRSTWENNFCLYLKHKKIKFEYEPETFYFPEKTGARGYLPDFRLPQKDGSYIWCEVKGHLDSAGRTKMKRMKKHYPEVFNNLTYVVEKPGCKADLDYKKLGLTPYIYYNDLSNQYSHLLKHWEK